MDNKMIVDSFYNNLEALKQIKEGSKVYIGNNKEICVDEPFMFQGIWRYWNNVSRKDAIHIITKLFNDIEIYFNGIYLKSNNNRLGLIVKYLEEDIIAIKNIRNKIPDAIKGIEELKKTYSSDSYTCEDLDKIISKCQNIIINLDNMISK